MASSVVKLPLKLREMQEMLRPGGFLEKKGKQLQLFITLPGLPLIKHGKASCSKPSS